MDKKQREEEHLRPLLLVDEGLLLLTHHVGAQLVGNRGVVQLPSGFEYRLNNFKIYFYILISTFRDSETLAASARASRFAKYFQPLNDLFAEQNKLIELQRSSFQTDRSGGRPPVFLTSGSGHLGQGGSEALYYSDTLPGQPQQPRAPGAVEASPSLYHLTSVSLPTYVARFRF